MNLALPDIQESKNHLELWAKSETIPQEAREHLIKAIVEIVKTVEIIKNSNKSWNPSGETRLFIKRVKK